MKRLLTILCMLLVSTAWGQKGNDKSEESDDGFEQFNFGQFDLSDDTQDEGDGELLGARSLREVAVTATRLPLPADSAGRTVTIVNGAQVREMALTNVEEALAFIPGVELQSRGGVQSDITVRGSTFQQVVVLIDGMRVNDGFTAHFNGNIAVPLIDVHRIEVLKGPAAAVYGIDAVGGVINIVTRSYNVELVEDQKALAQYGQLYGQHQRRRMDIGYSVKTNEAATSLAFQRERTDGYKQTLNYAGGPETFKRSYQMSQFNVAHSMRANNRWTYAFRYARDYREFDARNFYSPFASDRAGETSQYHWLQGRVARRTLKSQLQVDYAFKRHFDEYAFVGDWRLTDPGLVNDNSSRHHNLTLTYAYQFAPRFSLTTGFQSLDQKTTGNDRGEHINQQNGAFVVASWNPVAGLFTDASTRVEYNELFGWEVLPQFSANYYLGSFRLGGLVGRTLRAPDFTERFISSARPTAGFFVGNPDLLPEEAWSGEVSIAYQKTPLFTPTATLFYRDEQNVVDYFSVDAANIDNVGNIDPTAGTRQYPLNITELSNVGLDLSLMGRVPLSDLSYLSYRVGYLFVDTQTSRTDSEVPVSGDLGRYQLVRARHQVNGMVELGSNSMTLSLTGRYKQREEEQYIEALDFTLDKDYFVMDARFSAIVPGKRIKEGRSPSGLQLWVFGQAQNVFNVTYADLVGVEQPGRWLSMGFQLRITSFNI